MIEVIAEHSVDLSLLPDRATILDAGCRGFEFTDYFRSRRHFVFDIDCDNQLGRNHFVCALTGKNGWVGVKRTNDPQATKICDGHEVLSFTIKELSAYNEVDFWDIIKLDIEGSEYDVIMSMDKPYAKQLSVEFHLHTGVYGEKQMREMENKLVSLGYVPVRHEMTRQHGLGLNFWDSLWIWFENERIK